MSKRIWISVGSLAVLAVGCPRDRNRAQDDYRECRSGGHEQANGAPAPNAGGGAVPCNTTKSAAKQEICGTSTDSARWWNAAGVGTFMGAGSASWAIDKPTFFPPDSAYTHYAIPKGDEKYAALSGERIKGYI